MVKYRVNYLIDNLYRTYECLAHDEFQAREKFEITLAINGWYEKEWNITSIIREESK